MKKKLFYLSVILTAALILIRSEQVIRYVRDAEELCFSVIIPTLFPFFVCSGLLVYSGFGSVLSRAAAPVMRPVFNVAPSGAAAFVLGIISGFPLGALTAARLYSCGSLSKAEAERLLAFSSNSGPLFVIGTVGAAIYGKPVYGAALYAIHIISAILVGVIFSRWGRRRHSSPPMRLDTAELPMSEVITTALSDASKSILTVCFSIIFFSAISRLILDMLPLPGTAHALLSGIFEFSTGVMRVSSLSVELCERLVLTSFIIGFSGLCVHLQVMAVTAGSGLSLVPYMIGKLLHGAIAAILTAAAWRLLPVSAAVFSDTAAPMSRAFFISPVILAIAAAALALPALRRLRR